MIINTVQSALTVISPFGSPYSVPQGKDTYVSVEDCYWLTTHDSIEYRFESEEEEKRCQELLGENNLNPLKGIPRPQSLDPNAILQIDGDPARYPVIVVNPQGLLQNPTAEYHFGKPNVQLVLDKKMIREVLDEFSKVSEGGDANGYATLGDDDGEFEPAVNEAYLPETAPDASISPVTGEPEGTPTTTEGTPNGLPQQEAVDPDSLTTKELDELTTPEDSDEAKVESPVSEEAEATTTDEEEAPARSDDSKGRGRSRRGGIKDEDI